MNNQTTWNGARQRKAAQLKRDGFALIVICVIAALVCLAILLTGCGSAQQPIDLCDAQVSFVQVTDTSFDAYANGVVIAHNVTFDMIAAACQARAK